jgi:uncharacterized membrane-anchored protein YitT (DUF2179 family)
MTLTKKDAKAIVMVIVSAVFYAFAMKAFVNAGNLFPAGFVGISTLISRSLSTYANIEIPFGVLYFLLNVGPTIMVYHYVGKRFTIYSVLQYTLTSVFTEILPVFPLTDDLLLIAVFGGIVGGFAVSVALMADASTGGMDFIAIFFSNRFNKETWSYVMMVNAAILVVAGLLFSWEQSLYSIIYQFCSNQTVKTLHKRYKLKSLFIVTTEPEKVSDAVFKTCRHGITKINAEGMYSRQEKSLLYMTANDYQVRDIVKSIKQADPKVFITIMKSDQIVGNYYQVPFD